MTENAKIYRLNERDWVVAKSFDRAVDFLMLETGLSFKDVVDSSQHPHEYPTDMIVNIEMGDVMNYVDEDEICALEFNPTIECYQVPAHYIIEKEYKGEPFLLCSTEW